FRRIADDAGRRGGLLHRRLGAGIVVGVGAERAVVARRPALVAYGGALAVGRDLDLTSRLGDRVRDPGRRGGGSDLARGERNADDEEHHDGAAERRQQPHRRSGERDVGRALVRAAVRVDEGDLDRTGRGRLQRERERRVLAHALAEVEYDDRLAEVGGGHAGDVVVVAVHDLALGVALDALHRVDDETAHTDDVAGLRVGRHADADLSDVAHASLRTRRR